MISSVESQRHVGGSIETARKDPNAKLPSWLKVPILKGSHSIM